MGMHTQTDTAMELRPQSETRSVVLTYQAVQIVAVCSLHARGGQGHWEVGLRVLEAQLRHAKRANQFCLKILVMSRQLEILVMSRQLLCPHMSSLEGTTAWPVWGADIAPGRLECIESSRGRRGKCQ